MQGWSSFSRRAFHSTSAWRSTQPQIKWWSMTALSFLLSLMCMWEINREAHKKPGWYGFVSMEHICLNDPSCFGDISWRRQCPSQFCFSEGENVEHLNIWSLRDPHGELISYAWKFTSHPKGPSWLSFLPSLNLIAEYLTRNKTKQKINPCHALTRD